MVERPHQPQAFRTNDSGSVYRSMIRYKAHRENNASVVVHRYISTFPISGRVEAPWKSELYKSGLFDAEEMTGITRKVQYALKTLIRDEEQGLTIDQ